MNYNKCMLPLSTAFTSWPVAMATICGWGDWGHLTGRLALCVPGCIEIIATASAVNLILNVRTLTFFGHNCMKNAHIKLIFRLKWPQERYLQSPRENVGIRVIFIGRNSYEEIIINLATSNTGLRSRNMIPVTQPNLCILSVSSGAKWRPL